MNKTKRDARTTKHIVDQVARYRNWRRGAGGSTLDTQRQQGELLEGAKYFLDQALKRAQANDVLVVAHAYSEIKNNDRYNSYKGRVRDFREHGYPKMDIDPKAWPLTDKERHSTYDQKSLLLAAAELLVAEVERIDRATNGVATNVPYCVLDEEHHNHQLRNAEIVEGKHDKAWRKMRDVAVDIYPVLSNTAGQTIPTPAITGSNVTTSPAQTQAVSSPQLQPVSVV